MSFRCPFSLYLPQERVTPFYFYFIKAFDLYFRLFCLKGLSLYFGVWLQGVIITTNVKLIGVLGLVGWVPLCSGCPSTRGTASLVSGHCASRIRDSASYPWNRPSNVVFSLVPRSSPSEQPLRPLMLRWIAFSVNYEYRNQDYLSGTNTLCHSTRVKMQYPIRYTIRYIKYVREKKRNSN